MKFALATVAALTGLVTALPASKIEKRAPLEAAAGTNAYWLPFLTNDEDVETTFAAYVLNPSKSTLIYTSAACCTT